MNILWLEPDRLLAANARRVMKRAGHEVRLEVDPQAAINQADRACPDAIVLELLLAGRSGIEFLYEFRSYPDWARVPVIIYSSLQPQELSLIKSGISELNIFGCYAKSEIGINDLAKLMADSLQAVR